MSLAAEVKIPLLRAFHEKCYDRCGPVAARRPGLTVGSPLSAPSLPLPPPAPLLPPAPTLLLALLLLLLLQWLLELGATWYDCAGAGR